MTRALRFTGIKNQVNPVILSNKYQGSYLYFWFTDGLYYPIIRQ